MPSDDSIRDTIVDELDDLEERENIVSAWKEGAEEVAYPPKVVQERSRRLRESLGWRRFFFTVVFLLVAVAGGMGTADIGIPGALSGFLFGVGAVYLGVSIFTNPWPDEKVRALQLYELLKKIDARSDAPTPAGG